MYAGGLDSHLEAPHVSRVPCILQTVLVALQEELEEEPAMEDIEHESAADKLNAKRVN